METVIAAEAFGHTLPSPILGIALLVLAVGFLFANRGSGSERVKPGVSGKGMMHRCERCGRDFQSEHVELLANGEVRQWIDDHCPNCGWDLDWGSPDKPGGSSGHW